MEKEKLRQKIMQISHTPESAELSRQYFSLIGLRIESVKLKQCEVLSDYIQKEIYVLLADESYSMIKDLKMHKKIQVNEHGIFLFTDGYYFKKRQAISFEFSKDSEHKFIGFCGWAAGCNRIPYVKGFIKWCDYLIESHNNQQNIPSEVRLNSSHE